MLIILIYGNSLVCDSSAIDAIHWYWFLKININKMKTEPDKVKQVFLNHCFTYFFLFFCMKATPLIQPSIMEAGKTG